MDDLLALVEAKQAEAKQLQEQLGVGGGGSGGGGAAGGGGRRYLKRGDLERLREQEYLTQQRQEEEAERERKRRKASAAAPAPGSSNNNNKEETAAEAEAEFLNISPADLVKRLRKIKQPIKLFGESMKQTIFRLRHLESTVSHQASDEGGGTQRDDFREALKAAETTIAQDLMRKEKAARRGSEEAGDEAGDGQGEGGELLFRDAANLDVDADVDSATMDTSLITPQLLDAKPVLVHKLIKVYIKRLLKEWGASLMEMDTHKKQTSQGKLLFANHNQSFQYLKPFFKQLDKRQVPADVLRRVTEICMYLQKREYVLANDAYLRMSIGNAAWPLGVTSVGIHERANREKISESQIAHALNDETQRKWIQSLKRLMTFCQTRWPPEDVSKIVG